MSGQFDSRGKLWFKDIHLQRMFSKLDTVFDTVDDRSFFKFKIEKTGAVDVLVQTLVVNVGGEQYLILQIFDRVHGHDICQFRHLKNTIINCPAEPQFCGSEDCAI